MLSMQIRCGFLLFLTVVQLLLSLTFVHLSINFMCSDHYFLIRLGILATHLSLETMQNIVELPMKMKCCNMPELYLM